MPKYEKPINTKNARAARITLLVATILLFVFFAYTFISSYKQYQNIQQRIDKLHQSISETRYDYTEVLNLYNEAENQFRLFSIDFNQKNYNNYKVALDTIEAKIDSMLLDFVPNEEVENEYPEHLAMHKKLTEDFIKLRLKINELLGYSAELNSLNAHGFDNIRMPIPPSLQSSSYRTSDSTTEQNILVINKKPFFKRIFDNKADSIRISAVTHLEQEKEEIIKEFSQELRTTYATSQDRLNELKNSFSSLRAKERELLANNIALLHEVNDIIYSIRSTHISSKRKATELEIKNLLEKTQSFRWKTTLALTFMFVMICFIVYYQFFATYYEKKLINERSYASKLAQEKTDTLAEITHEIRTPISSLIGIIDILRKKEVYDEHDKLLLDSAFSNLQNTSKTINDILNISRVEDQTINLSKMDIRQLVKETVDNYKNQAKLKKVNLRYVFGDKLPELIYSDEFKLRQILSNLVSNAIKYSEKGTITCVVDVKKNRTLYISVQDEGIGIPKEVKDNIFKKYYTVTDTRKTKDGIGLGLYITKKIVQTLQGKISCESQVDKGTTFHVEVPLLGVPQHAFNSPHQVLNRKGFRIEDTRLLIVDDNPLNLMYMEKLLDKYVKVFTAKNGKEALQLLHAQQVDIVITDINMPIMGGGELLKRIRDDQALNHVKIMATSSDDQQIDKIRSDYELSYDYVLLKPFDGKTLNDAIYTVRMGSKASV